MKHDKLLAVSSKYPDKTIAQILLTWALQQGIGMCVYVVVQCMYVYIPSTHYTILK